MRSFLLVLVLLLSACDLSASRPPAIGGPIDRLPEGTRVENWRGGLAAASAQFHGEGGAAEVASGTLSAAGELEFALKPVQTAQLTGFSACPGLTVSDAALRLNSFSALDVVDGETPVGRVALVSRPPIVSEGLTQLGDLYLQYTYADRAARIEGSCPVGGAPGTFSYALELVRGWNTVVFKLVGEGTLHLSTEPVPADAVWSFSEVAR